MPIVYIAYKRLEFAVISLLYLFCQESDLNRTLLLFLVRETHIVLSWFLRAFFLVGFCFVFVFGFFLFEGIGASVPQSIFFYL